MLSILVRFWLDIKNLIMQNHNSIIYKLSWFYYSAHVAKYAWMNAVTATGDEKTPFAGTIKESKLADAFQINLEGIEGVKLEYSVHNRTIGWSDWMSEGQIAGYVQPDDKFGSKDIKDWKQAEAIKITVVEGYDKLQAAGYEIRYRVHLGYDGWEKEWTVADNSKTVINKRTENSQTGKDANGNKVIAGSVGWSRRIEALQVMLVKKETPLEKVIANALEEISKYEDYLEANKEASEYDAILAKIEEAKSNIEKATSEEAVETALDDILSQIKGTVPTIDQNLEDLQDKKDDALADIKVYEDVLNSVEGLSSEDKKIIKGLIQEAKNAINAANSEDEITAATTNFGGLMDNYESVQIAKAKAKALADLNEYLAEAKPGMKEVIEKAIEDVNAATTVEEVTEAIGELTTEESGVLPTLKNKQKEVYDYLKGYENYLATAEIDSVEKQHILDEIATIKEKVDNAKDAEAVDTAKDEFDEFMNDHEDVVTEVELQASKDALNKIYTEVVAKLNPYIANSNENVNALAQKLLDKIDDIKEAAEEDGTKAELDNAKNEIKDLYYGKGDTNSPDPETKSAEEYPDNCFEESDLTSKESDEHFLGYENALKHNAAAVDANYKKDKADRAEQYKIAMQKLAKYNEILKDPKEVADLELSTEAVSRIQEMLDATKEKVEKATTGSEIVDAMALLCDGSDGFLDKYYPNFAEHADAYEFAKEQRDAIAKLEAYEEQYEDVEDPIYDGVKDAITAQLAEVKSAVDVEAVRTAVDAVEKEIDKANKKSELEEAKREAIQKYTDMLLTVATLKEQNPDIDYDDVEDVLTDTITKITALDYDGVNKKNTPADVTKIEDEIGATVKTKLAELESERLKALKVLKDAYVVEIDKYIDIAKSIGSTAAQNAFKTFKTDLLAKNNKADVDAKYQEFETAIETTYKDIEDQYNAIVELENTYKEEKDADILSLVNKAIADIKKLKPTEKTVEAQITEITDKLDADVAEIRALDQAVKNAKDAAIAEINKQIEKFSALKTTLQGAVSGKIAEINSDTITRKTSYQKQINALLKDALDIIKSVAKSEIEKVVTTNTVEQKEASSKITSTTAYGKDYANFGSFTYKADGDTCKVTGSFEEVSEYTEFSNDPTEQTGHYLPIYVDKSVAIADRITVQLVGAKKTPNEIELKGDDSVFVAKITDKASQKIVVRYYLSEKDTTPVKTITYDLSGITD